ncbi:hypothetical protein ACN4EE_21920 [Geminocystis sp. CENA526]|uniref:hypothetical protein n=1 Tax=Geminocystis sp. CENA526 TaxID=1355871 RepID=UPI003D6EBEA7
MLKVETITYSSVPQIKPQEIESLKKAVIKLSQILAEKNLTEDDIVADFQELKKKLINE